ncbi:hypothetical protein P3T18_002567 [Paraburkholderia sp. GAS199]
MKAATVRREWRSICFYYRQAFADSKDDSTFSYSGKLAALLKRLEASPFASDSNSGYSQMKAGFIKVALTMAVLTSAGMGTAHAAGCLKGAVVGGVAGHYAGHHAVVGAVGGCIVGRHVAKKHAQEQAEQRQQVRAE